MDLLTNPDDLVDWHFGPGEPDVKRKNWILTEPGCGFCAMLRFYAPGKALPDIEKASRGLFVTL